jgi:hypothetical protein
MTPSNYTVPSGWSMVKTQDFEGTKPSGETWGGSHAAASTTQKHSGSKSWGGLYDSDQDTLHWIANANSVNPFTEVYVSYYEYVDSTARFNDEWWQAQFYINDPFQEIVLVWFWPATFNATSASLYIIPQGVRYGGRHAVKSTTVPTGTWHQWEIHYKQNTITDGVANSDGFYRVYMDGTLWGSKENWNFNGTRNMNGMSVKVGGIYTKLVWMTDYPTCSVPSGCSAKPGSGTDLCTVSQHWSGQSFADPVCNPIDPPLASYRRYFDDIILMKKTSSASGVDSLPPYISSRTPASGATGVASTATTVTAVVKDDRTDDDGIVQSSIAMTIEGTGCTETITGSATSYTVSCTADSDWTDGQVVNVTLTATDVAGYVMTSAWSFTAATSVPALNITTTTLAGGQVGTPYSATLASTGGTTPVTWSVSSGSVPFGTSLSSAGVLSGTPTTAGAYTFTALCADAAGVTDTQSLTATILAAPGGTDVDTAITMEDTWIGSGDLAAVNYSDNIYIRVYEWNGVANRTLIMDNTDIQNLPDNIVITSAKLKLWMNGKAGDGGDNPMNIYLYSLSGILPVMETVTWNTFAATMTQESVTPVGLDNGWVEFECTNAVQSAYAARSPLYLALDGGGSGTNDSNRRFSSYQGLEEYTPRLVITYEAVTGPGPTAPKVGAPGRLRISKGRWRVVN